jgi:hypothetical protein
MTELSDETKYTAALAEEIYRRAAADQAGSIFPDEICHSNPTQRVCRYGFDPCHVAPERNVDDSRDDPWLATYSASTSARRLTRIVGDTA